MIVRCYGVLNYSETEIDFLLFSLLCTFLFVFMYKILCSENMLEIFREIRSSESGDVWKISWNLKIVATSVDTSNKNFQNSQNHIVVVFSGSHVIEISADFSDVSWFTDHQTSKMLEIKSQHLTQWMKRGEKNQLKSLNPCYQKKPLLSDFVCFENFCGRYPLL